MKCRFLAGFIDWQVVNAAMTSDAFCSSYCHGCNDSVTPVRTKRLVFPMFVQSLSW
jgi:hypothetical protein